MAAEDSSIQSTKHPSKRLLYAREYSARWRKQNVGRERAVKAAYYKIHRERILEREKVRNKANPANRLLLQAKIRAKKSGLEFNLSIDDIIVPTHCPALGIKLVSGHIKRTDASPTLDRVNPKLGYIKGNVAVISWRANRLKSNALPGEIKMLADWLVTEAGRADKVTEQLRACQAVIRADRVP